MLHLDKNQYISLIYNKSVALHDYISSQYQAEENLPPIEQESQNLIISEEEDQPKTSRWDKDQSGCDKEAKRYCKAVYQELKLYIASDVYLFINPDQIKGTPFLLPSLQFLDYPRKEAMQNVLAKIIEFQNAHNLIDFHPNYNDLGEELKQMVDERMKKRGYRYLKPLKEPKVDEKKPSIRNLLHQSLQPYHQTYCTLLHSEDQMKTIWSRSGKQHIDIWGKGYAVSPSQFLWLPTKFVFSEKDKAYHIDGKLFHPLEECPDIQELKDEVSHLLSYFAPALKETHQYFSKQSYQLRPDFDLIEFPLDLPNQNKVVSFDQKIHSIVKISEMTIDPHSTYTGQWHVEGYSSDNILYTCLYIIQQDERLTQGKLKFKRASRFSDSPVDQGDQEQCAHQFCPDYEALCDQNQLIPLGSLDLKENLMIVFPNQNIHKVKGIKNDTDFPLKRRIIAFFVVNHETQPFTVNDVQYTKPLEFIKQQRLLDMYERSKNKQTDTQSFEYCEH